MPVPIDPEFFQFTIRKPACVLLYTDLRKLFLALRDSRHSLASGPSSNPVPLSEIASRKAMSVSASARPVDR